MRRKTIVYVVGFGAAALFTTTPALAGMGAPSAPYMCGTSAQAVVCPAPMPMPVMPAPMIRHHIVPPRPVSPKMPCATSHAGPNCAPSVKVLSQPNPQIDPITISNHGPMDHLRSVHYSGAPHVSITRVYGQNEMVGLKDAPSGFTQGCHPHSTHYCGKQVKRSEVTHKLPPAQPVARPVVAQPYVAAPYTPPAVQAAPVVQTHQYWEKVSGPTMVGGLPATQIICKREAKVQQHVQMQPHSVVVGPVVACGPVKTHFKGYKHKSHKKMGGRYGY